MTDRKASWTQDQKFVVYLKNRADESISAMNSCRMVPEKPNPIVYLFRVLDDNGSLLDQKKWGESRFQINFTINRSATGIPPTHYYDYAPAEIFNILNLANRFSITNDEAVRLLPLHQMPE